MRWLLIAAVAAAVAVASAVLVLSGAEPDRPPRLRVAGDAPLTVAGRGFVGNEIVFVVVRNQGASYRREVRAGDHGTFRVTLVEVRLGRCGEVRVVATGERGSRASAKLPRPLCPP